MAVLKATGFEDSLKTRRGKSDFGNVKKIKHKSARHLRHLEKRGADVVLQMPLWSLKRLKEISKVIGRAAECLRRELLDFVKKGFWSILPWLLVKKHKRLLRSLRINLMGVVAVDPFCSKHACRRCVQSCLLVMDMDVVCRVQLVNPRQHQLRASHVRCLASPTSKFRTCVCASGVPAATSPRDCHPTSLC